MLQFVQLGFAMGPNVIRHLTHDTVATLLKAQRHLYNESHRYKQFVRFSVSGRVLTSVIKPLNQVLPLIALIYRPVPGGGVPHLRRDPRHGALLPAGPVGHCAGGFLRAKRPGRGRAEVPDLWCEYYDAIAIEGRYNPKCRMNHMPKRYWRR